MSLAAGSHPPLTPEFLAQDARSGPRIGIILVNSVAIVVLLLRIYARCFLIKCFGWDDALMCVAGVRASSFTIGRPWLEVSPGGSLAICGNL